jgi:acyl carrier protein
MREDVTGIVEEVLQGREIRPDVDLFDQGATSLAFVRIIASVNDRFGTSLTGSELVDGATVDNLVAVVEQSAARSRA